MYKQTCLLRTLWWPKPCFGSVSTSCSGFATTSLGSMARTLLWNSSNSLRRLSSSASCFCWDSRLFSSSSFLASRARRRASSLLSSDFLALRDWEEEDVEEDERRRRRRLCFRAGPSFVLMSNTNLCTDSPWPCCLRLSSRPCWCWGRPGRKRSPLTALARSATHARHQPNKHQPECQHRAPHG